jgi:Amt family ammonium transporter
MDSGNLAWAVAATALVLFMTPGVAFFYGGLVKAKSVVSMMMMSFGALGLISVLWILYGFNMSAVDSTWAFAGNPFADLGLASLDDNALVGAAYGATFAIITVALISGAIADRAKFGAWMIFAGIWATVVYFPVAAWVWGGGWIMGLGETFGFDVSVIDYAGGTAVHINAGAAALALSLVLGRRVLFQKGVHKPHNVPLVMLGAAILWFGWFGFNAGGRPHHRQHDRCDRGRHHRLAHRREAQGRQGHVGRRRIRCRRRSGRHHPRVCEPHPRLGSAAGYRHGCRLRPGH